MRLGASGLALALVPVGIFYRCGGDDLGRLLHADAVGYAVVAHACAAQPRQVGAAAERRADVARKRPDVRALAALHPHAYGLRAELQQLYGVDFHRARLQLHFLTCACALVCPHSVDFACRERRWHLKDGTRKPGERFLYRLAGDMRGGVGGIYLGFQVEARGGGAERYFSLVLLASGLQLLDALGGAAGAYQYHACCQRVERAGVTHFQTRHAEAPLQRAAHSVHGVERRPALRFVNAQYFAAEIVHLSKEMVGQTQQAGGHAVHGKPYELAFLHYVEHPFACHAAHDERGQEAYRDGAYAGSSSGSGG